MKYGVQMYAIRTLCKNDLEAGIKAAAEIGYDGLEFAGFFGHSAEEVAGWLKKYGVEAMGAHIPIEEICGDTDNMIAFQKAIGNHRIVCPWSEIKTGADTREVAGKLAVALPKIKAAGMELYYHNHAHEFKKDEDKYLIDILAEEMPELKLELDVYWVYRGGEDPMTYLKKYEGRTGIFHAKDGTMAEGTLAGKGNVDLKTVCAYAKAQNFDWAVVESEATEDLEEQVESIRKDYAYISAL